MDLTVALTPEVLLRPARMEDAAALADAQVRSRDHLRPWEPRHDEDWFTAEGQAAQLRDKLKRFRTAQTIPWLLVEGDRVVGAATLSSVVLGPYRNASLGYWIDAGSTGRGLATAAVRAVCRFADTQLRLHRIEASAQLDNLPSQRVLEKCGFERIGVSRSHLHINGDWVDCLLFHKILNSREPGA
jgi:[ribosomal protein S5]-alanine N-acetyltransferase